MCAKMSAFMALTANYYHFDKELSSRIQQVLESEKVLLLA
jgi:hypothetical protein